MSEPLSPEVRDRICAHMNEDHAEAVLLYVKAFGCFPNAISAKMLTIESDAMEIVAIVNGEPVPVHITFDRALENAEDAHHTLIEMVKEARKMLTP
jgi:putative heme iron utilization protein